MKTDKICVISDTHGDRKAIKRIIEDNPDIKTLIHLGDNDIDVEFLSKIEDLRVISVRGNCDYSSAKKSEEMIILSGKRIFITHGHEYNVM